VVKFVLPVSSWCRRCSVGCVNAFQSSSCYEVIKQKITNCTNIWVLRTSASIRATTEGSGHTLRVQPKRMSECYDYYTSGNPNSINTGYYICVNNVNSHSHTDTKLHIPFIKQWELLNILNTLAQSSNELGWWAAASYFKYPSKNVPLTAHAACLWRSPACMPSPQVIVHIVYSTAAMRRYYSEAMRIIQYILLRSSLTCHFITQPNQR